MHAITVTIELETTLAHVTGVVLAGVIKSLMQISYL